MQLGLQRPQLIKGSRRESEEKEVVSENGEVEHARVPTFLAPHRGKARCRRAGVFGETAPLLPSSTGTSSGLFAALQRLDRLVGDRGPPRATSPKRRSSESVWPCRLRCHHMHPSFRGGWPGGWARPRGEDPSHGPVRRRLLRTTRKLFATELQPPKRQRARRGSLKRCGGAATSGPVLSGVDFRPAADSRYSVGHLRHRTTGRLFYPDTRVGFSLLDTTQGDRMLGMAVAQRCC